MFHSKEFLPPKVDTYLTNSAVGTPVLVPHTQLPIFRSNYNFVGPDPMDVSYDPAYTENSDPTPMMTRSRDRRMIRMDDVFQDYEPKVPPREFSGRPSPNVQAISELNSALSREKASLMAENANLKSQVSAYEQRLSMMDARFQQMMSRISALEKPAAPTLTSTSLRSRRSPPIDNMSPKSQHSAVGSVYLRTGLKPAQTRSVSAPKTRSEPPLIPGTIRSARSRSVPRVRSNSVVSLSKPSTNHQSSSGSSGRLSVPSRSVAAVARAKITNTSNVVNIKRAVSPHATRAVNRAISPTATRVTHKPMSPVASKASIRAVSPSATSVAVPPPPTKSTSPGMKFELQISLNDQLLATCSLSQQMHADGPFLYIIQSELHPGVTFTPIPSAENMFSGIAITVIGTNTKTWKSNTIFKSHSSHVSSPPIADGYFTHSCWLSGPGASVVGGVRVYFKPVGLTGSVTLYAMSLKYWFPDNAAVETTQNFTTEDWKDLLKLLGIV